MPTDPSGEFPTPRGAPHPKPTCATVKNVELKAKYECARQDRERYWSQLFAARALSDQCRYALHYVIYPDEGRTVHPTTGRLQELAEPDAE